MAVACLIGVFVLLTLMRRDAWPFTRYPMFSRYRRSHDIRIVCVALEREDGILVWWRPRFHRYSDGLAGKLAAQSEEESAAGVEQATRLLKLEHGDISWWKAVHVRERRWVNGSPLDRTVFTIPLRTGAPANRI